VVEHDLTKGLVGLGDARHQRGSIGGRSTLDPDRRRQQLE
jgi:hypothetical protein